MSFAEQVSICSAAYDLTVVPTEQEWHLARLKRPGMFGNKHVKQVLHPGRYRFNPQLKPHWRPLIQRRPDVTQERADHVRKPKLTRLANPSWQHSEGLDWTMYLPRESSILPVPVETADDASLGYYNCRIIRPHDVISLRHRSIVVDFCYQEEYYDRYVVDVCGGCSIEHHDFAHVDMPLDKESGHLLIGRIDPSDQALELTAFIVKPMDRVYIPAQTIHTNDYLLGTWETMLSSECEFPSARLKPSGSVASDDFREHALPLLAFCE